MFASSQKLSYEVGLVRCKLTPAPKASDPSRVLFVFPDAKHEEQFLGSGSGYRADCAGGHSHIYCALEELLTSITGRPSLARRFSKEAA